MIILVVGFVLFLWLVLSFIELPMDNRTDWVQYWNKRENKWKGKE